MIEPIAGEWRVLCAEGPCDQPFFYPEFIAAYVRAFAARKTLVLLTTREDGRLRAVLPLIEERATLHGVPVRKLRSASNVHSARFDLIHGQQDRSAAVQSIWQALQQRKRWDVIELLNVPAQGAGEQLLSAATVAGFPTGQWEMLPGAFMPLPAEKTPEEIAVAALSTLGTKQRNTLRRKYRQLNEQGSVQVHCYEQPAQQELDRFYDLERGGWKGLRDTAIACDDGTRQFYNELARASVLPVRVALYQLTCADQIVAMQYCLLDQRACYLLKPAYDERFCDYSPGHLLVYEVLRDLLARGRQEYDFMAPQSEWKSRWTKALRAQSNLYIFRRSLIGYALQAWKFRVLRRLRQMKQHDQAD